MKKISSVSVLVFNGNRDSILMVEQRIKQAHTNQENAGLTFWSLPGGKIDAGQSVWQAVHDELYQETNQRVAGEPLYLFQTQKTELTRELKVKFFECAIETGRPVHHTNDPDHDILAACWVPFKEAKQLLNGVPDPSYKEPLLHYLRGLKPEAKWRYSVNKDGDLTRQWPVQRNSYIYQ